MASKLPVFALVFVTLGLSAVEGAKKEFYFIVASAEATGTDVVVYSYARKPSGFGAKAMKELATKRFRPSILGKRVDKADITQHVDSIKEWARTKVPWKKQNRTAILFYGSDAMRSLSEPRRDEIMSCVRHELSKTDFNESVYYPFYYAGAHQAQVLSGEEQGMYQWVTLNYIHGKFQDDDEEFNLPCAIVNLDKESFQIAYLPKYEPLQGEFDITILRQKYALYVSNYQGFGKHSILEQIDMNFKITGEVGRYITKENPCFLKTNVQEIGYVTYIGTGEPVKCREALRAAVVLPPGYEDYCLPGPCGLLSTYQAPWFMDQKFYLSGCFYHCLEYFGLLNNNSTFDPVELKTFIDYNCVTPILANETNQVDDFLDQWSWNCLCANYIYVLIGEDALDLPNPADGNVFAQPDIIPQVTVTKNGAEKTQYYYGDWRLGAFLVNLNAMTVEKNLFERDIMPTGPELPGPSNGYSIKVKWTPFPDDFP